MQENGVGSVLVSGESEKAPYGFLRKVTGVETQGDNVRLVTEQASLTDIIEFCDVKDSLQIRPADVDSVTTIEGVVLKPTKDLLTTTFDFGVDLILYDEDGKPETENDQIRVEGELAVSEGVEIQVGIDWDGIIPKPILNNFLFATTQSTDVDIQAFFGESLGEKSIKKKIATIHGGHFTVPVGPVPVVFVFDVDVYLKASVGANVSVEFGFHMTEQSRSGYHYYDGSWHEIDDISKTVEPLSISTVPVGSSTLVYTPENVTSEFERSSSD